MSKKRKPRRRRSASEKMRIVLSGIRHRDIGPVSQGRPPSEPNTALHLDLPLG